MSDIRGKFPTYLIVLTSKFPHKSHLSVFENQAKPAKMVLEVALTFYDSDFVKYFNNKQPTRPGQNHGQLISGRVLARSMNIYFSEKRSPQV